ncbi:MAG: hypothetical protein V2B15_08200 [Bacteroidota bacterium]
MMGDSTKNVITFLDLIEKILDKLAEYPELLNKLDRWFSILVFILVAYLFYKIVKEVGGILQRRKSDRVIRDIYTTLGEVKALLVSLNTYLQTLRP